MIEQPYLLFLGDAPDQLAVKVAQGIRDWRPDTVIGQLRLPQCRADLGLPDLSLDEAVAAGARTLVVGVANRGGVIAPSWLDVLGKALVAGLDLASGLHSRLTDQEALVELARDHGRSLQDVRESSVRYPIATGARRPGRRCLAVGTDCSIGKMYTMLALERAMRARGSKATFRATGQTGILISGTGVPLDAVVADFMAGAIEWLTPENDPDHWDLIEGQGSLFHPSFSGVTLALVHGGQPDALVLCHDPVRPHLRGLPHFALPSLEELAEVSLRLARMVNPDCRIAGLSIITANMEPRAVVSYLEEVEQQFGVPAVDPMRLGADRLAAALVG
jgi:uncharacterized NAD-dependent epimerase/dehydratase family protein